MRPSAAVATTTTDGSVAVATLGWVAALMGVGLMHSQIERRLLINYRVDPVVAQRWIPEGLRVQIVDGAAIAGICMIRLARVAPRGVPGVLGWRGENAAQRVAVEWDEGGSTHRGVFISRRFSASPLAVAAGGRLFPGVHSRATIAGEEAHHRITLSMRTAIAPRLTVDADVALTATSELPGSVFPTVTEASEFFRTAPIGLSPARTPHRFDALQLTTDDWRMETTAPISVRCSLFDDLPVGAAELDSVLLMRDVPAVWTPVPAPPLTAGIDNPVR